MIDVYVKSGHVFDKENNTGPKSSVAVILNSMRYRWLRTRRVADTMSRFEVEAIGLYFGLSHIRKKFRKKKIRIYSDSVYLQQLLAKTDGEYNTKTKLEVGIMLRNSMDRFPNIKFLEPKLTDENWEELQTVYLECGLDDIVLDENE